MQKSYIIIYCDLVGYSTTNENFQINFFKKFHREINHILYDEMDNETCIIIPTGDGVITALGVDEGGAAELRAFNFIISILEWTKKNDYKMKMAMHVGNVNVLKDVNKISNIVGHVINDASRMLAGANINGVVISDDFYRKFLIGANHKKYERNILNDELSYFIGDEDIVIDKHLISHKIYNFILYKENTVFGSNDKMENKYFSNIYSTDYPKKRNLAEKFIERVKGASELDFIGIYNPSLPAIISNLRLENQRNVNLSIFYAADILFPKIEQFFGTKEDNLNPSHKQESIQRILEWHKTVKNVNLSIFEYGDFLPFGASMVDKGISDKGFIHISNYFPNLKPADTPYIEVEWKTQSLPPLYNFYLQYLNNLMRNGQGNIIKLK